jgi:isopenicillin-N epimerase
MQKDADARSLWSLDPEVTFLNHGSFGACPVPVLEHQSALRARMEREPVRFFVQDYPRLVEETRQALADFVGCDPAGLALVPNATTGVNAVLRSLALEPGDELLLTDHAYNACRNALEFVADRCGAQVVVARVPFPLKDPTEVVEAIVGRVSRRTRLALLDHVTSPTGLVLPLEELVEELQETGIDVLVDGAHAPGMVDLDVGALGAAYYTGNCHKWLCAPKGAGFLHVREDRREQVRPAVISHGANAATGDRSRFHLEFDWTGTFDPTGWFSVPEALRVMGGLFPGGWDELRGRNRDLVLRGRAAICASMGIDVPCPDRMIGSLAAIPLPDGPSDPDLGLFKWDPLQQALFERYRIQAPVYPWPAPPRRFLRVSAQAYNTIEEYGRLAAVLTRLLG